MAKFHREDEPHGPRRDKSGGGAVLVVVLVAAGLLVLACVGGGIAVIWLGARAVDAERQEAVSRAKPAVVPDLPPAGMVRVVAEKVREDDTTVRWKWTVVGDRNWSGLSGSDRGLKLTGSYPLGDQNRVGGANAFECEFAVSAAKSADGTTPLAYEYSLQRRRDSGGGTGGGGVLWSAMRPVALPKAVKVLLTGEQTLPLPLDAPLVEVAAEAPDGRPLRHTFRIKVSE